MVAHLLRLKLTLLRNSLRRSVWQVVGLVFGGLYAFGAVVLVVAGLAVLGGSDVDLIRTALILTGSLLVLAWWFVPLVALGVDATLDPARFVTFAIPRRSLLTGLALSGVIGVPGATTAVVVLATTLAWRQHPAAAVVAAGCALVAIATCLVGSRATTTAFAPLIGRRRVRELIAIVALVPLLLLGPAITGVLTSVRTGRLELPALADAVRWTPFGAVWAIPADVAAGAWGTAGLEALVALSTLAALVVIWDRSMARALVTPASSGRGPTTARGRGLGAFGWLPATPTGAVAARSLTYWIRDPRYAAAVAFVPILPFLLYFSTRSLGMGSGVLLAVGPLVGFLLGWSISADVSYDSTAFWTHVAAPISGRVDRLGRVLAAGLIGLPATLALVVGAAAITGRWDALPAIVGASVGVLLTALGGSSVVSARVVYQVAKPGESPFASQPGTSMAAAVTQLVGWAVVTVLSLPEVILAGVAVVRGSAPLGAAALVVGLALGAAMLALGIRLGSSVLDRRAPELLERMVSYG